jgi:DNA-binding MarR family transcriptional regulator
LPALLSQVLVAFTVELDNEFEHQMPHRTTRGPAARSRRGPWLVSLPMWSNFLRFVPADPVPLTGLADLAALVNLAGLERWGYVVVEPDPADRRPKPPRRDWLVRTTAAGQRAQAVWRPLPEVIEKRWRERFGAAEIGSLTESLQALAGRLDPRLPRYLPVAGVSKQGIEGRRPELPGGHTADPPDLSVLLSRALAAFTIEFERESALSLALSANALRVLSVAGVRVPDLPLLAGVSREAVSVSLGFLERNGCVVAGPDPAASRTRLARLTPRGVRAQEAYQRLAGIVEERWLERFGADDIGGLRGSLRGLIERSEAGRPLLALGLRPYPGGWRAHKPYLAQTTAMTDDPGGALPHYPMVSHRGGFPDGS